MPGYPKLYERDMDLSDLEARMRALAGAPIYTPYSGEEIREAEELARAEARGIADQLRETLASNPDFTPPEGLERKEVVALIAYLGRLGTDIKGDGP